MESGGELFDEVAATARKESLLPAERLTFSKAAELERMERGIIFIFAVWSAPCILGFKRFTKVLSGFERKDFIVIVVDIDALSEEFAKRIFAEEGSLLGGWGEGVWVRNGKVIARMRTCNASEEMIAEHPRALFR